MSRTTVLNGLFLLAGCSSAAVETILYRLALIAIVLLLRAWWARAVLRRAIQGAFDAELDDAESVLIAERNRRIAQRAV